MCCFTITRQRDEMTWFENMRGNEIIWNGLKYEFSNNILSFDEFHSSDLPHITKLVENITRSLYEKPAIFLKAEGCLVFKKNKRISEKKWGGGSKVNSDVPLQYILYSVALGATSLNLHKEIYKLLHRVKFTSIIHGLISIKLIFCQYKRGYALKSFFSEL